VILEAIMRAKLAGHRCLYALVFGALVPGANRAAGAETLVEHTVQLTAHHVEGARPGQAPVLTPEEIERHAEAKEEMEKIREQIYKPPPVDPTAVYATMPSNPPTEVRLGPSKTSVAPGDFTFFRDSNPGYSPYAAQWWDPNEPTAAANGRMCLYTGNIYGRLSGDHGMTFSALNIDTFPPAAGGAAGDFVTYYERTRGLMIWYLEYNTDGNGNNIQRIAVANGQSNLANNSWTYWDVSPATFGFPTNRWLDYPDVAAGSNILYVSTNVANGTSTIGSVIYRVNLDQLAAGGSISVSYVLPPSFNSFRLATGAGTTMYFGDHIDNNTLRIYSWPETGSPVAVDRDVSAWQAGTSNAQSPDGTNWLASDLHRIVAAWLGGGRLGFMWDSAEGGAYAQANVRYARFDPSNNLSLTDEGTIWNTDHAWGYPSAHPNDSGAIGGTIHLGGRTGVGSNPVPYPSAAAWIADAYNGYAIAPMESMIFATGTNGPSSNQWGDYYSSRMHDRYSLTWVGTGYIEKGGSGPSNFEPHYVWFGRQADTPPANHSIYVDKFSSAWQNGSGANPYRTIFTGVFATVPGDRVVISAGTYNERLTLDRACTITTEGGSVFINP
jgi:hypothetical protein